MTLRESLAQKKFIVTSEVQVPLGDEESDRLVESLGRTNGTRDGMSVSQMALEGIVGDTIRTCGLLKKNNLHAIYQTTLRDKNRFKIQKDLLLAHDTGVENLLVFTEDYKITGDTLQESMFFHVDSGKLASVMDHLKKGVTVEGVELDKKIKFILGCGVEIPLGKTMTPKGLEEMEDMMNMGVGYFLTTPVFDVEPLTGFMEQAEPFKVPVIAEVIILRSAGMGKFLNRHFKPGLVPEWVIQKLANADDKQTASIEIFSALIENLKTLCQGVHIVTIGGVDNLDQYLKAAKLR